MCYHGGGDDGLVQQILPSQPGWGEENQSRTRADHEARCVLDPFMKFETQPQPFFPIRPCVRPRHTTLRIILKVIIYIIYPGIVGVIFFPGSQT